MQTTTNTENRGIAVIADTKSKKLGRKGQSELSRLALLIEKITSTSSQTQKQIADAVGFKNQNMITMIKQGDSKLPLDRVPAMARALGIDPAHLFDLALEQFFTPEAIKDLKSILPPAVTSPEREVLEIIREGGKKGKALNSDRLAAIREIFD